MMRGEMGKMRGRVRMLLTKTKEAENDGRRNEKIDVYILKEQKRSRE